MWWLEIVMFSTQVYLLESYLKDANFWVQPLESEGLWTRNLQVSTINLAMMFIKKNLSWNINHKKRCACLPGFWNFPATCKKGSKVKMCSVPAGLFGTSLNLWSWYLSSSITSSENSIEIWTLTVTGPPGERTFYFRHPFSAAHGQNVSMPYPSGLCSCAWTPCAETSFSESLANSTFSLDDQRSHIFIVPVKTLTQSHRKELKS